MFLRNKTSRFLKFKGLYTKVERIMSLKCFQAFIHISSLRLNIVVTWKHITKRCLGIIQIDVQIALSKAQKHLLLLTENWVQGTLAKSLFPKIITMRYICILHLITVKCNSAVRFYRESEGYGIVVSSSMKSDLVLEITPLCRHEYKLFWKMLDGTRMSIVQCGEK